MLILAQGRQKLTTALIEPKLRFIDAMAKPLKTNQSLNCAASAEVYWSKERQPKHSIRYLIDILTDAHSRDGLIFFMK